MLPTDLIAILDNLQYHKESERLEFKMNLSDPEKIAETICALSNASCIKKEPYGYIIWWVADKKDIIWTDLDIVSQKITGKIWKTQGVNLRQWLQTQFKEQISIDLIDIVYKTKVIRAIKIQSAQWGRPTLYNNIPYVRIVAGEDAHNDNGNNHPELLKQIYNSTQDNTSKLTKLQFHDLDPQALHELRRILLANPTNIRFQNLDDEEILRRIGILKDGYITYGWALLLGKEDFAFELFSDKGQITRKYEDIKNNIVERRTWTIPFILHFDEVIAEIQRFNTTITETTLFRKDLKKYEIKALRELLFNSIVHKDWTINQWVEIIQTPQSIKFINPWLFVAVLNDVLRVNKRPDYRNPHLSNIFKACSFIEKEWWWLREVYNLQLKKWLSIVPTFETTRTTFELLGYIKDIDFAKAVEKHTFSDVYDLVLLDRIVTGHNSIGGDVSKEEAQNLKNKWYVEVSGARYQKVNLAKDFAKRIKKDWVRTRIKWLDKSRYKSLIKQHIEEYGSMKFDDVKEICKGKSREWCSQLMLEMRKHDNLLLEKIESKKKSERLYRINSQ